MVPALPSVLSMTPATVRHLLLALLMAQETRSGDQINSYCLLLDINQWKGALSLRDEIITGWKKQLAEEEGTIILDSASLFSVKLTADR